MAQLPGIAADGISSSTDLTRSAGLAAEASADAFGRVARASDQFAAMAIDHLHTVDRANVAQMRTSVDADVDVLRAKHLNDPDGFKQAYSDYRTKLIESTPHRYSTVVASYADRVGAQAGGAVAMETARVNHANAVGALKARLGVVSTRIGDALSDGRGIQALTSDPQLQSDQAEYAETYNAMVKSGAISREEADAKIAEESGSWKAAAVTGHILQVYHAQGADAALKELQGVSQDPSLAPHEQHLAFEKARTGLGEAINVDQERTNVARTQQAQREQDARRIIDDDAAAYQLTGKGSGVTEDQVRQLGGPSAVVDWYKKRADALRDYRLYGDLSRLSPDQAAQRMADVAVAHNQKLPEEMKKPGDFDALWNATKIVEHGAAGVISQDPDGAGPAGGGAYGVSQVTPDTARLTIGKHPELGPYDENRLLHDNAYNEKIGKARLRDLVDHYNGDAFLATTAYHAGEGNVDGWIKKYGDPRVTGQDAWLEQVRAAGNPRSAAYPQQIAMAYQSGGKAWEAWDAANKLRNDDPAQAVAGDPMVQAATAIWQQSHGAKGGFSAVQSYMDAQARAGIKPMRQQPLPNAALDAYVNGYVEVVKTVASNGHPGDLIAFRDKVLSQFKDPMHPERDGYGRRVLQAVLERAGASTATAAALSNVAIGAGTPQAAQLAAGARADALGHAASGSQPAPVIPQEAVAALKKDPSPEAKREFDEAFKSPGAADRLLKGG